MIYFNAIEEAWFCNEWRSACHIVKKGAKKKGIDLSKMELVAATDTFKKGCEKE